ncbi:helix-turn-helix domain-containing protein [Pseudomonas japonica]|uniref:Homeodomain-like domain-containing protein n=1 Tax=Pseudomonas japonica TaxID=256466 RepID=A0A239C4V2_9PSED|nr:helix-turn-helix domain-containing protein [Pseudomonas japonica]SNS14444.1 Homeodomain-like domain-containing protein [Pseudomonas japonica]
MVSRESLAAVLRLARASREMSRDQLYAQSKIEPRHLQRLENARTGVTLEMLGNIAEALSFDPMALLMVASSYDAQLPMGERHAALKKEIQKLEALGIVADMPKHFSGGKLVGERAGWRLPDNIAQNALLCRDQGLSQSETARKLGIHQTTVGRIWRKSKA